MSSVYFGGFKDGKIDGLLGRFSLGPVYGIILGSLVGYSVGSSEVFKDFKIDGTIVGNYLG